MPTATATATAAQLNVTEDRDHDVLTCACHAQARRNAIELDLFLRLAYGFPPFAPHYPSHCYCCNPQLYPTTELHPFNELGGLDDFDVELDEVILRNRLQLICYIKFGIITKFQEPASLDDAITSYLQRTGKLQ